MSEAGYINFFEILDAKDTAKPGEVRNAYKKRMKSLVADLSRQDLTSEQLNKSILDMAQLNAAVYVLRDNARRDAYWAERTDLIALEEKWCTLGDGKPQESDALRKEFDTKVRSFLSKYVEEMTLEAGYDKEVMEASHWSEAHARHATRLLRHFRHNLYSDILERLPYYEVTRPDIDWDERKSTIASLIAGGAD